MEEYRDRRESYRGVRFAVLRAVRCSDGAAVVLKTVRPDLPDPAPIRARLQREHDLLTRLDVTGVLRPYALLRSDDEPVLVSHDAGGLNLEDWLERKALAPALFLDMAIELCTVLAAVHERGVIHGDVTPFNVVVGEDRRLTLVDFDAAVVGGGPALALSRPLDGSLAYIAPEQTGRMNRPVDRRADLYGLGATFYEMLTGAPPFPGSDPIQLVHAHLARAPVPPAHVDPRVPPLLSDLVCKLLAKMPEARYQSAAGLLADLRQARERLSGAGVIEHFELGQVDLARQLPIPDELYGRHQERATLAETWAGATAGGRETVWLNGPAGIGKSALVEELGRTASEGGAWFAAGKFDLQPGGTPYRALAEAADQLARAVLSRPVAERTAWQRRLGQALGLEARALVEVAPALERLLGPLPPRPSGSGENRNGFASAFQILLGALARPESPVLLFIDDLQRADRASLELVGALAAAPDLTHLLVVGAYRADEVDAAHPLATTRRALQDRADFRELALAPLEPEALLALVCEAFRCPPAAGRPLAELLLRKTAGNPFFIRRLLRFLHGRGLIAFDAAHEAWSWDLAALEKVSVTENVVDLLVEALRGLPAPTREALTVAACIGKKAELGLIGAVLGQSPAETARALDVAVREGLLEPDESATSFQFAHDRVQQAAGSLLAEDRRQEVHLRVGRRLLEETRGQPADDRVFTVADHLTAAAPLVTDATERTGLADLCLRAGRKARASSAYGPALDYLQQGRAVLPADAWRDHHRLALLLHREAMECAEIAGQRALADRLFELTLAHTDAHLEKVQLYNSRVIAATMQVSLADAIHWGREGLRLFDTELPTGDSRAGIAEELAAVQRNLAGRTTDDLLAAPSMSDPAALAQVELLSNLRIAVYSGQPALYPFIQARLLNLALVHGNAALSPSNYVSYGLMAAKMGGDRRTAYDFGRLGVELARKLGDLGEECRATAIFSGMLDPAFSPLRNSIALARRARALGRETGLHLWRDGGAVSAVALVFHQGTELPRLLPELNETLADAGKAKTHAVHDSLRIYRQEIRCLQGLTRARSGFDDEDFDERALLANANAGMTFFHAVRRLEACYLLGNLVEARAQDERATRTGNLAAWALVTLIEHNFYGSLTRAALAGDGDEAGRREVLAAIAANQRTMKDWADGAPENYRHKHLLVEAEVARLENRPLDAGALYDQAIAAAARAESVRDEALGNELAARFYRQLGRTRIGGMYLEAARRLYTQWGAKAKVDALDEEFPDRPHAEPFSPGGGDQPGLDQMTLFRAAELISGELVSGHLFAKLTEVCLTTSGAVRAVFLLEEDEQLCVRAVARVDEPARLQRTPLASTRDLPLGIVEQVRRTGLTVVLADAAREGSFQSDPYIAQHGVRSVLALPIRRQAKLVGVLYLENDLATRVFTPERVRLLQLLSSQLAVSLESSMMFEALSREVEERKRAEARVRFLAEAGAALSQSLEYESTLARVVRMAVPALADWCLVDVLENGVLQRVAAAHRDPTKERLLEELRARQALHGSPGYARLLESNLPSMVADLSESALASVVKDPEVWSLIRQIGAHSSITVPLRARDRAIGLIIFVSAGPERRYGPDDVTVAQELARRAATAIDNARLYREAQQAVQIRDEFLSVASHELRTPLTALLMSLQGMLDSAEGSEAVVNRLAVLAERQGQRLARLVDDLLDTVRLERGGLPLRPERVDLGALVRDAVARFRPELDRAGCPIRLELEDDVIGWWDPARLDQVLLNLLSNAAKFGAGREIVVRLTREQKRARLAVSDRGIGIEPARHARIFERFERGVSAQHYGGLGLGLFISRRLVEAQGGTIEVESQLGYGATFVVTMPRRDQP